MPKRIHELTTIASAVNDSEWLELSKLSTVSVTATTISALASDNSFNDSGSGFISAGFSVGRSVKVTGFTGNVANNIVTGRITALTASKMTIGGADGDVIVDDAAGESVTITQWASYKFNPSALAAIIASALPSSVSFNTAIPFDGNKYMPTQTVNSVIAFTVNSTGAVEGGTCVVDLIADGSHIPTFTGFRAWDGSAGYVNVYDVRNIITFFRRDGLHYYSIGHDVAIPLEGIQPPIPSQVMRLTFPTNTTESGNSTSGWTYQANSTGFVCGGRFDFRFQSSVDGVVEFTIDFSPGSPRNAVVGIQASATWSNSVPSITSGVWVHQDGNLYRAESGVYTNTGVTWANGNKIRLTRTGSNLAIEKFAGSSWSTVYTFTGVSTGVLYVWLNMSDSPTRLATFKGLGLST